MLTLIPSPCWISFWMQYRNLQLLTDCGMQWNPEERLRVSELDQEWE